MKEFLVHVRTWFLDLTSNMSVTDEDAILTALLLIVVTGLIGGAVAKKLKQPLILGYILAGVVVGYLFKAGLGEVANTAVNSLANVGVALLLFSMGLEFSKKDIRPVFKIAVFGALAQVLFTFLAGTGIAWLLSREPSINFAGDTKIPLFSSNVSLFLFGICFVSTSTAVVLKTLSSKGFENSLAVLAAVFLCCVPLKEAVTASGEKLWMEEPDLLTWLDGVRIRCITRDSRGRPAA